MPHSCFKIALVLVSLSCWSCETAPPFPVQGIPVSDQTTPASPPAPSPRSAVSASPMVAAPVVRQFDAVVHGRSEVAQPASAQPGLAPVSVTQRGTPQPHGLSSEIVHPERVTPEIVRPETLVPERVLPERGSPEIMRPLPVLPDTVAPERVVPLLITPEVVRPERVYPAAAPSASPA